VSSNGQKEGIRRFERRSVPGILWFDKHQDHDSIEVIVDRWFPIILYEVSDAYQ
jgi:hypothetical protein